MIVIGTLPSRDLDEEEEDVEMSFSPHIPTNDIFSRDVDPDVFVRPVPRRRGGPAPSNASSSNVSLASASASGSTSMATVRQPRASTSTYTSANPSASTSRSTLLDEDVEMAG